MCIRFNILQRDNLNFPRVFTNLEEKRVLKNMIFDFYWLYSQAEARFDLARSSQLHFDFETISQ